MYLQIPPSSFPYSKAGLNLVLHLNWSLRQRLPTLHTQDWTQVVSPMWVRSGSHLECLRWSGRYKRFASPRCFSLMKAWSWYFGSGSEVGESVSLAWRNESRVRSCRGTSWSQICYTGILRSLVKPAYLSHQPTPEWWGPPYGQVKQIGSARHWKIV